MAVNFSTQHNSGCTLTNNNTTAETNTTTFRRAVSSTSASSGKISFEFTIDSITEGIFLGITSDENPDSSNVFIGSSSNSYGIYGRPVDSLGNFNFILEYDPLTNSGNENNDINFSNGDTVAFTFDADNGVLYYSLNGGTVYQISGIASGTYYPVMGGGSASQKVIATISEGQDISPASTSTSTTFKNAIFNYEQQFYIDQVLLSGVTNVNGEYSISESPINVIGHGYQYPVRQGPLVGNFNVSKYYIGEELLLNYTGSDSIVGSINFGEKSFGFNDGYLTEYSLNVGIGSIPQSNASIVVYGNIGSGVDHSGDQSHPDIQIPNQGSITLNCANYSTNRVTSFSYTMRMDRSPVYKIGSNEPVQVDMRYPIFKEATFALEVNDAEIDAIETYLLSPKQHDLNISFANPINSNVIETFTIEKARLLSQSITSSSDDLLSIQISYNGYVNKR